MPVRKIWFDKMIREMEEEEEKRRIDFKEKIDGVKLAKYKRENPSLKNRLETTFKSLTDKIDESDTETEILIDKVIKLIEEIKEDEIILKNEKLDNGNVNGDRLECPFGCNSFRKDPKLMLKHIIIEMITIPRIQTSSQTLFRFFENQKYRYASDAYISLYARI